MISPGKVTVVGTVTVVSSPAKVTVVGTVIVGAALPGKVMVVTAV